ncbi:uncharacterized protein LOC126597646 [Malus sylvestris]|uniref:uncharacterized protein LOC126597646 n=1 Tax=Malus sylvestris TaxID=3752 RepID=UPI0021AC945D|nr:uncharacterized protein LOC126597646 [Malus sylvestris]
MLTLICFELFENINMKSSNNCSSDKEKKLLHLLLRRPLRNPPPKPPLLLPHSILVKLHIQKIELKKVFVKKLLSDKLMMKPHGADRTKEELQQKQEKLDHWSFKSSSFCKCKSGMFITPKLEELFTLLELSSVLWAFPCNSNW